MEKKILSKPELIRSVHEGTTLLVGLTMGDSVEAWRVRASELNRIDGYKHYSVELNKFTGQVAITAHEKEN